MHIHTHIQGHTHKNIHMCHPRYTFNVVLNLKRYEVCIYATFNPMALYPGPCLQRCVKADPLPLLCLGSCPSGCRRCVLVPSSGESHFLPQSASSCGLQPWPQVLTISQAASLILRNNGAKRAPLYFCLGSFQFSFWVLLDMGTSR